jgi:ribose transport system ATP-binding protein
MSEAVLEMHGIRKAFPGVVALAGVDLTLHAGEVHILLGENGAGKSTLMKILSGAYRKDAGELLFDGVPQEISGPRDALALGVRIIYQELNLVPGLSVAENIFLGSTPTRWAGVIDRPALHTAARRVLADLGVDLDPAIHVQRLSLAHRQLVEIAKALRDVTDSDRARILVMDEPTSALTAREVDQLFAVIGRLTARGVAVAYITHRLDEVYRIGQRVTVIRDGCHVATRRLDEVSLDELVRLMANRELGEHFPKVRQPAGGELLRVEKLRRDGALFDVDLSLRAGEVLGIGGLLGAGRTELARVISGADHADGGRIVVNGRVVTFSNPSQAIEHGIGLLPEDRKAQGLVAGLTTARNIALPHGGRLARFGLLPRRAEERFAEPWVKELRIRATASQPVRLLSGGNQQKVVLGKWVAGDARIFIFDEPTRGVDIGAKVEIYGLMNRLTARGAGIIMISSELPELLGMSDRIVVMHRGRIRAEFEARGASQELILGAALGLN